MVAAEEADQIGNQRDAKKYSQADEQNADDAFHSPVTLSLFFLGLLRLGFLGLCRFLVLLRTAFLVFLHIRLFGDDGCFHYLKFRLFLPESVFFTVVS